MMMVDICSKWKWVTVKNRDALLYCLIIIYISEYRVQNVQAKMPSSGSNVRIGYCNTKTVAHCNI